MKNMIVVAHHDDEVLGMGGTIFTKVIDGDEDEMFLAAANDDSENWQFFDYENPLLTQTQWNRFYSLHCNVNAEELIINGLAVRKV